MWWHKLHVSSVSDVVLFTVLLLLPCLERYDFYMRGTMAGFLMYLLVLVGLFSVISLNSHFRFSLPDGFISVVFAYYLIYTLTGEYSDDRLKIWNIVGLWAFWLLARQAEHLFCISAGLFFSAFVQSMWGILQQSGFCPGGHIYFPVTGGFPNPGLWGGFLVTGWFAGLQLLSSCSTTNRRIGIYAGLICIAYAVLISWSRASWMAWITGIMVLLFNQEHFRYHWKRSPNFRFLLTGGSLLLLGGILGGLYLLRPLSADGRLLVWRVGWSLFCQSPLTGHGPGSFEALYMLAQGEFLRNYPGQDGILAGNNRYAFNECLHIACETGLAGILTGAGLLLLLYISGNRKAAACLWSGLLSVLVFACFSYPFSFLTFQVVVVGLAALLMSGRQRKIPLAGRIPFAVAIGLLLLSGGKEYILREKAERFMRKWHSASTSALYKQEAAKWYARLPASADFVLYYGRQLYLCGDYQKATEVLQQALQLRPCSGVAADLGDCYFRCGKYPEAENMLKKAVDVVPSSFNTRYRLFCFYRDTGQTLKAGQMAEEIAAMKMKVVNTTTLRIRREIKNYLIR